MLRCFTVAAILCFAIAACARVGSPALPSDGSGLVQSVEYGAPSSYKTIFRFDGADGSDPSAVLLDIKGQLYGTTASGGNWSTGGGTVFVVTTDGKERVLHNFGQPGDGQGPFAGLVDMNGTLYGTTYWGGKYGHGAVFSMSRTGAERVLHSFGKGKDGSEPESGLTALNGALYGTTFAGGAYGVGTVFSISSAGDEHVIHSFTYATVKDGAKPVAGLIALRGKLYGTTAGGGLCNGTAFAITPAGDERILHNFGCMNGDGYGPAAALVYLKGTLYGTTEYGGLHQSLGTVFSLSTAGKERVLFSFDSQKVGMQPDTALIAVNGVFYGATYSGGAHNEGAVFSVDTAGREKVLHSFGAPPDGHSPSAGLTDVNGALYGTAQNGGNYRDAGTIFKIAL
jgi:uncharacterized repeat protein (TIGR03803 family)